MGSEIYREKQLANFKPTKSERIRAKMRRPAEKRAARPGNDEDHLAAIRKLPCCISGCGRIGHNDPHHLKIGTGDRAAGRRSSDRWAVPLCRVHHDEVEDFGSRNEPRWFRDHGIESALDLAAALWAASPDVPRMTAIVIAHRGGKT